MPRTCYDPCSSAYTHFTIIRLENHDKVDLAFSSLSQIYSNKRCRLSDILFAAWFLNYHTDIHFGGQENDTEE